MDMKFGPFSTQDKIIQAVCFWLFAVMLALPVWDGLYGAARCFDLPIDRSDLFSCALWWPAATIVARAVPELGTLGFESPPYWPAVLIGSTFTMWVLSRWWRLG
jgi:hypothetical protein